MPSVYLSFAIAVELLLLFAGCVLGWRLFASPAAQAAARQRGPALLPWDIRMSDFFLFIWLVITGGFLVQIGATALLKPVGLDEQTFMILSGASFHFGLLAGVIIFRLGFDRSPKSPPLTPPPRRLLGGLVTFLIALPLITGVSALWQGALEWCGLPTDQQELIAIFANARSPWLIAAMSLLAIVIAPVAEELVFRAGLFRFLRTRVPRWAALAGPACLFAALHLNLASFVPLAVLGVVFSLAYERTGSIAVPIVAHGLFNLNTILLIYVGAGLSS